MTDDETPDDSNWWWRHRRVIDVCAFLALAIVIILKITVVPDFG